MNVLEPDALAAYVRYGFRDRDDGQVELACVPEVEARCFEASSEPEGAPHAFGYPLRVAVTPLASRQWNGGADGAGCDPSGSSRNRGTLVAPAHGKCAF